MTKAVFDVLNIEYQYENDDDTDYWPYTMTVSVEHDENKHFSFTEDAIKAELESYITLQQGEPVKVVDLTAFYTGTKDPLRGNYEDYEAETFEAREKKIGSITIKKNPNFPSGTSLQAYIKTNRAELRKVFGNPNMGESGDGKSKGKEWNLVVGGKRVTIYDKREKGKKGTKYFNIGGDGKYSALLVAQALSIHRNERIYAKEIVPKWLEDRRQYQQVKSIDEHPDLTYERAKEYEDNRRRYRAETFEAYDPMMQNRIDRNECSHSYDDGDSRGGDAWVLKYADLMGVEDGLSYIEAGVKCGICGQERIGSWGINEREGFQITKGEEGRMPRFYGYYGAETFDVEFNEWAEQEMMSHGKDISFKDWAEDEGMKHGNVPITEWAEHEEESHDARYGAEDWGGNPKGKLALALQKARENAKKPKKPLKIEKLDAENERPKAEMSYYFVYVPNENGKYGREGEKYDVHYFPTLEEAQEALNKSFWRGLEIYEYRVLEDVPPEEREKQEQDGEEWYDRAKKGEFFEDFWWKDEMSRYSNSDAERLHHSTYDSSVENDERDGFYENTILPSDPSRREQETNRYIADDLGISETLAELLNASRTFGMYISQRAHPDTVKKYRQRILDGFDAYSPESKKEQKIVKMVRQNMATRGVKGPRPSYYSTSRGMLRKPELSYYFDDYYDNPIPFMGYELTDEEKKIIGKVKDAETSGQWEIGEQLEEAQMNAEGKKKKKLSGVLSDPFDELSLDSGGWKSIAIGFGVATLTLFGLTKLRK